MHIIIFPTDGHLTLCEQESPQKPHQAKVRNPTVTIGDSTGDRRQISTPLGQLENHQIQNTELFPFYMLSEIQNMIAWFSLKILALFYNLPWSWSQLYNELSYIAGDIVYCSMLYANRLCLPKFFILYYWHITFIPNYNFRITYLCLNILSNILILNI